ncbi:MAG: alkaline phosphatase family protein, partial [Steroidobacteraceae bacterium]
MKPRPLAGILAGATLALGGGAVASGAPARARALPPIRHVFVVVLENESYETAFGRGSPAAYLARALPAQGALLSNYYGIGHSSLDNYLAMISGQAPNVQTQLDCPTFGEFQL